MPYTNEWTETLVPGSTPAREIDDKFRLLSLAIKERMEGSGLVADWSADPVVKTAETKGEVTGKKILIGGSSFRELNGTLKAVELNPNFLAVFRGSARVIAPVILPAGVTLKLIEWFVNRGDVTNYTWRLVSVLFASPATESVIATNTDAVAGLHIHSQVLNHTIADSGVYYLDLDTAGAADVNSLFLYGVRLTYDTPDSTKTL
jgi:hypothetical protein